jgi:hypothetical protein
MKLRMLTLTALLIGVSAVASASELKNLKVLRDDKAKVEKGMKLLSKGLGVKCEACHVKGKFDSDDVQAKHAARTFLETTVSKADADRSEALKGLLGALQLAKPKAENQVWEGIGEFARR